jgi:hypothetical protein
MRQSCWRRNRRPWRSAVSSCCFLSCINCAAVCSFRVDNSNTARRVSVREGSDLRRRSDIRLPPEQPNRGSRLSVAVSKSANPAKNALISPHRNLTLRSLPRPWRPTLRLFPRSCSRPPAQRSPRRDRALWRKQINRFSCQYACGRDARGLARRHGSVL